MKQGNPHPRWAGTSGSPSGMCGDTRTKQGVPTEAAPTGLARSLPSNLGRFGLQSQFGAAQSGQGGLGRARAAAGARHGDRHPSLP